MKAWQGIISVWDESRAAPDGVYRQHMPKVLMTTQLDCPAEEIRRLLHERVDALCDDLNLVESKNA